MARTNAASEFLVVGAGSSGAAVAGRLSERGHDVVLLEAGPDWRSEDLDPMLRTPRSDVFAWRAGVIPARYVWDTVTASRAPGRAPAPYIRGRGLGGTSTINGLVAIRPPLEEFDEWAAAGCHGWSSTDVLPYFVRLENDIDYGDASYHGNAGPVPVVRRAESAWGTTDHVLADAAIAAGHAWSPDHNAPGALGASRTASNIRLGVRVTTNDGYLEPARQRANLRIVGNAEVDRVLFESGRATGVRAVVDGEWATFHADTVVLCAGSAGSPTILQRSGIGPAALLNSVGIPVVADSPTGVGMQDHVGFWVSVGLDAPSLSRTGTRGNVTLRYSSDLEGFGAGDVLMVSSNPVDTDPTVGAVGVKLAQSFSRGSLEITSSEPLAPAAIQLNMLTDERDRRLGRQALRDLLSMLTSSAASRHVVAVRDRDGRDLTGAMCDDDVDAWLRGIAYDTSHLSGGAGMGGLAGLSAVVDSELRVLGVEGLRVADMSVVPTVPRANAHLTAVMIGERLADLLSLTPSDGSDR